VEKPAASRDRKISTTAASGRPRERPQPADSAESAEESAAARVSKIVNARMTLVGTPATYTYPRDKALGWQPRPAE